MNKYNYLNLGCGQTFHESWTNVDFYSSHPAVIQCNLINGIPFEDSRFDVVYHSHVLEHFSKEDGEKFIKECYRVLRSNGIIRVAIPDLEQIVTHYLKAMNDSLNNIKNAEDNYDWMMLELYDQTIRNHSGGEMAKYLFQENILNEEFVYKRIGIEGKNIRKEYLKNKSNKIPTSSYVISEKSFVQAIRQFVKYFISKLFHSSKDYPVDIKQNIEIGKFRKSGEIHQWMYDRFSLRRLLEKNGFRNIEVKSAHESAIADWKTFNLEITDSEIRKPDSLFIEAIK
jgi:predicted SAM-dependent methyltransferase